jgi:putative transposase
MDDRRMLLSSILCELVRWLLGLIAVLVRKDLSKDAELLVVRHQNAVLRRQISRIHYTICRPGVAGRFIPAAATSPLGRGLPGHACHDLGLAPPVGLAAMGLHRSPPTRTSTDCGGDQEAHCPSGDRESEFGTPARAGRTGPPPHRRLHCLAHPPRGRYRSRTVPVGPDVAPVPHHPAQGHPGRGLRLREHRTAPTVYALIAVKHGSRRARLVGVTARPTAAWWLHLWLHSLAISKALE